MLLLHNIKLLEVLYLTARIIELIDSEGKGIYENC